MISETRSTTGFAPIPDLRWLFFDLNSYFASVEQQENPALRGKPVAVVPAMTDATSAIAASYEAKAFGIKTGTKIYEAKKLCPDLVCVLARHDLYVEYHRRIFGELENHLHVTKICSVDEAACLLLGNERIPAEATALVQRIKQGLMQNIGPAITCSVGIAPNAFLAKVASDLQKPNGLVILEPGQFQERLFALKLTDLPGINVRMEQRLRAGGVTTVEGLWNLAPKHARTLWGGVGGERFWYKLRGYDVPDQPTQKRMVGHSRVLDPAHRSPSKAFDITSQLTVKAAVRLRRTGLYARRLSLYCKTTSQARWGDERVFSPTQDNFVFLKYLDEMWGEMLDRLRSSPLQKVSITLHDLFARQDITLDLFETAEPRRENNIKLSQSMDALNKRFGQGTIAVGANLKTSAGHVGTKIAFTRVPDQDEF
jgi:DNA polymerase-4